MSHGFLVPAAQRADRAHRNRVVFPLLATWTLSLTGWSFLLVVSLSMAGCDAGPQHNAGPLRSEAKTYLAGFGRGTISRDRAQTMRADSALLHQPNLTVRHSNSTVKLSRLKTKPPFSAFPKPFFAPDRPRTKDLGLASEVTLASNRLATQENSSYKAKSTSRAGHQKMVDLLKQISETTSSFNQYFFIETASASQLRQALATLPTSGWRYNPSTVGEMKRCQLLFNLAEAESKLGNELEAIEHMESVYKMLPKIRSQLTQQQVEEIIYRLGLLYLRYGETQNCCLRNTPDSCIIPFQTAALHTQEEGSRAAIRYFTELLQRTSGKHDRAKWLLNIAYMTLDGYPAEVPSEYLIPPETFSSNTEFPRFKNIATDLGLNTFNGAGTVIVDDLDGDGWLDILTSNWNPTAGMRFFKNRGDGSFADHTIAAGLDEMLGGINMVQADYDNDGDLDVYILRGSWLGREGRHPNSLLQNDGAGRFTDVTFLAGLGEIHYPSHSASWADYDNDGDLDLYVGNENIYAKNQRNIHLSDPSPSQWFRNEGNGTFTDVAAQAGVENMRFAKAVTWGDYDGDRFPDLYVSNYGTPNRLYHNNGDGSFTDVAADLDVDRPLMSFPAWFWDFDNDGQLDLYVSSYDWQKGSLASYVRGHLGQPNTMAPPRLYRGTKEHRFEEVAQEQGVSGTTIPMGANFGDLDNDGFLDFYLGTGYPDYEALMPNVMYHNQRGTKFHDVTFSGGFGHLQKGHGIAFADFDHDGDQDVVAQMGGFFHSDNTNDVVFENPGFENRWITIKLTGTQSNRAAIGARIHVVIDENGQQRSIYKHVNSGGSFGANPLRQTIGLGKASQIVKLEIYWPTTDTTQTFSNVPLDTVIHITEGKPQLEQLEPRSLGIANF
jgi:hypothetical protein